MTFLEHLLCPGPSSVNISLEPLYTSAVQYRCQYPYPQMKKRSHKETKTVPKVATLRSVGVCVRL